MADYLCFFRLCTSFVHVAQKDLRTRRITRVLIE